jgi:hypothetical protein
MKWLQQFHVFFCRPLDLDYSMLRAFFSAYQVLEPGRLGPRAQGDARSAVLGDHGTGDLYDTTKDDLLRWYRYLFLGRGKPGTHVRVLGTQTSATLKANAPEELRALLESIATRLGLNTPTS